MAPDRAVVGGRADAVRVDARPLAHRRRTPQIHIARPRNPTVP
ncbi:hypothetical protein OG787_01175 [Streptomyces sp. NBC_00075]|uniref:Uncharacterized protein n=1 Tax=Streptomyces sp. NBC_00093 TaxID=2975649 RepID=A0AAU1ZS34_9ACTN